MASRDNYAVFDAVSQTPLLTTKQKDQSNKKWDVKDETGLRFAKTALNVEFHRDRARERGENHGNRSDVERDAWRF